MKRIGGLVLIFLGLVALLVWGPAWPADYMKTITYTKATHFAGGTPLPASDVWVLMAEWQCQPPGQLVNTYLGPGSGQNPTASIAVTSAHQCSCWDARTVVLSSPLQLSDPSPRSAEVCSVQAGCHP